MICVNSSQFNVIFTVFRVKWPKLVYRYIDLIEFLLEAIFFGLENHFFTNVCSANVPRIYSKYILCASDIKNSCK